MLFSIIGALLIASGVASLIRPDLLRKFLGYSGKDAFPDNVVRVRAVIIAVCGLACVALGSLL